MILAVEDLRVGYGNGPVLSGVGLELRPGEALAILGPNGAGKTTLLRSMNAMLKPSGGAVRVEGADVFRLSAGEIARRMGYVAQRGEPARLTAFDAILLGRKPHMGRRVSRRDLEIVEAAIERIGLRELALRYVDEMSGGELQKVCIARALVQEPVVLLLDEPTASLDLRNQTAVLQTIRALVADRRMGAVMTMHDLNLALRFTDTFILLKDGEVLYRGRREELTAGMIERVYGVPVEVIWHRGHPVVVPEDEASLAEACAPRP